VLAARLSEMTDARVLLLEAGPRDLDPYIHMPVGFFKMTGGRSPGLRNSTASPRGDRVTVYRRHGCLEAAARSMPKSIPRLPRRLRRLGRGVWLQGLVIQ